MFPEEKTTLCDLEYQPREQNTVAQIYCTFIFIDSTKLNEVLFCSRKKN